jgi:hypothetical protein
LSQLLANPSRVQGDAFPALRRGRSLASSRSRWTPKEEVGEETGLRLLPAGRSWRALRCCAGLCGCAPVRGGRRRSGSIFGGPFRRPRGRRLLWFGRHCSARRKRRSANNSAVTFLGLRHNDLCCMTWAIGALLASAHCDFETRSQKILPVEKLWWNSQKGVVVLRDHEQV